LLRAAKECEAHLDKLAKDFADAEHDAELDYAEGHEAVARLRPLINEAEAALGAAGAALQQFDAEAAAAERRAAVEADATRPRRIAEDARAYHAAVVRTHEAAKVFAAAMGEMLDAGAKLGQTIGGEAQRQFGLIYLAERMCYGFDKLFQRNQAPDAAQTKRGLPGTTVRLLQGLKTINPAHRWCKQTLHQIEWEMIAGAVDYFPDRASAEAVRKHRDPSGQNWHVVEGRDGIFRLVEGTRRMKAAE
jgi:hypothetical protein